MQNLTQILSCGSGIQLFPCGTNSYFDPLLVHILDGNIDLINNYIDNGGQILQKHLNFAKVFSGSLVYEMLVENYYLPDNDGYNDLSRNIC